MTERSSGRATPHGAAAAPTRAQRGRSLTLLLLAATALAAATGAILLALPPGAPLVAGGGEPTPATLVWLDPTAQTVTAGSNVVVEVRVEDVPDEVRRGQRGLGAYEFILEFDPAVVSFLGVQDGPFLASTGRFVTCLGPTVGYGSVRYGCVSVEPPLDGPIGGGLLATVTFSTSCAGSTTLDFAEEVGLVHVIDQPPFPNRIQGATVTVTGGEVCGAPTATPTSTETPLPTATPEPTVTPGGPTLTPSATPTVTPTATAASTNTPTSTPPIAPTSTPTVALMSTSTPTSPPAADPTPTATRRNTFPPLVGPLGDASGDGAVDSLDALLILWFDVRILPFVPFLQFAEVNGDLVVNAVDAALILQFEAGLLSALPP